MAEQDVGRLWAELDKQLPLGNYDTALHVCNKLEKVQPNDAHLLLAKICCLINVGQYETALKEIDSHHELHDDTAFQRAYCLYRLNQLDEAIALVERSSFEEAGQALAAQIQYRKEDYASAVSVFKALDDDDNHEIKTNYLASIACGLLSRQNVQADAEADLSDEASHELAFNLGCVALAKGDYPAAERWIKLARETCHKTLADEGFEEADIEEEMGQMTAQLALVYQQTGRAAEARQLYDGILRSRPSDALLTAVVSNNLAALHSDRVYDMKQRMKAASGSAVDAKMTSFQKGVDVVNENVALLSFHDKQADQCDAAVKAIEAAYPSSVVPYLIRAATLAKSKQLAEAVAALQECQQKHKGQNERVALATAQLQMQMGDTEDSAKTLLGCDALRYRPGALSAAVSLLAAGAGEDSARVERAREVSLKAFDDAIRHAEQAGTSGDLPELLRGQAEYLMANAMPKQAAESYLKLVRADPSDKAALAGLVTAYSRYDLEKAELYAQQLPAVDGTPSAPVDSLENALPGRKFALKKTTDTATLADQKRRKKRKGRKGKLPKDKDAVIDPERWLPKWQRSYNRKKYKKQQQAMRGPQGAAAPSAPSQTGSLGGLKGKAAAAAAPPSSDSMAEGQGSNQPSGKKSTNAKKKKKSKF